MVPALCCGYLRLKAAALVEAGMDNPGDFHREVMDKPRIAGVDLRHRCTSSVASFSLLLMAATSVTHRSRSACSIDRIASLGQWKW